MLMYNISNGIAGTPGMGSLERLFFMLVFSGCIEACYVISTPSADIWSEPTGISLVNLRQAIFSTPTQ
jgi:hypothetical protein